MTTVPKDLKDYAFQIATEVARLSGKEPLAIWNSENFQKGLQEIAEKELERLKKEQK
ncbi:hypothetical protein [Alkalihalobacterium bogoriense]|uniref:hypothetical protein n=1 Tax=Alkalihalobacterium bogoriense TaxID=246272 RepID=UPI000A59E104|nr:hypothetical protein [Alkalihalobacterium bogoriense]